MNRLIISALLLTGIADAEDITPTSRNRPCPLCNAASGKYTKRRESYPLPAITLTDHRGKLHKLPGLLDGEDDPVLLTFSFTCCSTICPVLNATFASVQKQLAKENRPVRLITISIDPAHDTPNVLAEYAKSLNADDNWTFLTGTESGIQTVRKAFNAHTANKGRHAPLAFIRANTDAEWLRLDGLMSSQQFLAEFREAINEVK